MNYTRSTRYKAIAFALTGFLCFSLADAMGKFLTREMDVFALNFWLSGISVLVLLAAGPWLGGLRATLRTRQRRWHLIRAVLTGFIPLLNFYALAHMPLVNFYTIVFTAPFFTVIFARFMLGERTHAQSWFLIALGFIGVLIALRPSPATFGWPELAVLASALLFSVRNLTVAKMGKQETMLSYGLYGYGAIVLFSAPPVLMDFHLPPTDAWPLLIAAGILVSVGLVIFSLAFRLAPAAIVAPTHYSQMIWGMVLGLAVFNDWPDFWDIAGGAVVMFCGFWLVVGERWALRRIKDPARPPGT
ncbi:MAG: DMT family transporter [Alphaproteobacteria bacterium]|nr:DMT family transporter [Alphaproteobacteria bacterium]